MAGLIMAAVDVDVSVSVAAAVAAVSMVVTAAALPFAIPRSIQLWPGEKRGHNNQQGGR